MIKPHGNRLTSRGATSGTRSKGSGDGVGEGGGGGDGVGESGGGGDGVGERGGDGGA